MSIRKYQSEIAVNLFCDNPITAQPDDFERSWFKKATAEKPCHIYMICARPRITFDAKSISFEEGKMRGRFMVQLEDDSREVWFETECDHSDFSRVKSSYPYTIVDFHNELGERLVSLKTAAMLQMLVRHHQLADMNDAMHLQMEVLYVGQSYGEDGSRQATDRLTSHETLQKVYSEIQSRQPHKEVWLTLLHFQPPITMISIDGRIGSQFQATKEEDEAHVHAAWPAEISFPQQINYSEAALIRYFQPTYNKIFKNEFPSPAHKSYKECYDLDLSAVAVEIQTGETFLHLYSDTVPADWVHIARFDLHSREDRESMFIDLAAD